MDLKLLKNIIKDCNKLTLKYKKRINKDIKNTNQIGGKEINKLYLYIKNEVAFVLFMMNHYLKIFFILFNKFFI
jgi:hypothetical protein